MSTTESDPKPESETTVPPTESTTEPQPEKSAEDEEAKKKAEQEALEKKKAEEAEKQKAEEEAAAKQKADADAAKQSALEKEIADLEKEVEQLKTTVAEKEKVVSEINADAERAELKEATEKHNEASKALKDAEQEKFELQPNYEQCLANKEQKDRADGLKREIEQLEADVKKDEAEVAKLDEEMTVVTSKYSEEKESFERFSKALTAIEDGLKEASAFKIAYTINAPAKGEAEDDNTQLRRAAIQLAPNELLDSLFAIVREREREASHAVRQLRELKAICDMKKEEEQKLQAETGDVTALKQKENDEYIKQLIYSFQDIRSNLQADIEEIRKVNRSQAINLRRGHVEKSDAGSFSAMRRPAGTRAAGGVTPRQSSFRKEAPKSAEVVSLTKGNEELQKELNTLKKKLSESTTARTEALRDLKSLQARLKRDTERFRETLREMDAQIAAERFTTESAEIENSRLAEAVEQLTQVMATSVAHIKQVRAHHDPLPIEDAPEN